MSEFPSVPGYRLTRLLGEGGMGRVYLAEDIVLGRRAAIKFISERVSSDPETRARFLREARAMATVEHPHVVRVYSFGEASGDAYFVMEYVAGETLSERLKRTPQMDVEEAIKITRHVVEALDAAWEHHLVHRDIKPSNILIDRKGQVRVADFGLAKPLGAGTEDTTITQTGGVLGTPHYVSPEQARGDAIDLRSDIYSLGIVLYEMLAGTRPFIGKTPFDVVEQHMHQPLPPIEARRTGLPPPLVTLLKWMTEKDPVRRPRSYAVLRKSLGTLGETGVTTPVPETTLPFTMAANPPMDPRHRASAALASIWPALAVGKLEAHASDPDMESLARGLAEDIVTGLARFPEVKVLAAGDPGARYVIEGSVRRGGDSVRASLRLVDVRAGAQMWAENYDQSLGGRGLFDLQDDVSGRVVATVAAAGGVLMRSAALGVKDRLVGDLTIDELVLRQLLYSHNPRPDEHLKLRGALEKATEIYGRHAGGWACLASLHEHEHSLGFNSRPRSQARAASAAERAVEIDPACQAGWRALAARYLLDRDLHNLKIAADRAVSLNPLNSATLGFIGMALAYSGDWDRGIPMVRRAIDLNPQHPGWLHHGLFAHQYRLGEYDAALTHAKLANLPQLPWNGLAVAAAAGQLGRSADARAAIDGLQKNHAAYLHLEKMRALWAVWVWDEDLIRGLMDGVARTRALTAPSGLTFGGPADPKKEIAAPKLPPRPASIAVLPFTDLSMGRDHEWLCEGIADGIRMAVSRLKDLRVAPRDSAFSFRGKARDLRSIGEKLKVATLLVGSVRLIDDRLQITTQLTDARDGSTLALLRYDRELKDVFLVQEEIARAIAEHWKTPLAEPNQALLMAPTADIDAYVLLLKARPLSFKQGRRLFPALDLFHKATQQDASCAPAWQGIAEVLTLLGYYGLVRSNDVRARAGIAAERAVELAPGSAEAHRALACTYLLYGRDPDGAEQEFKKALELNPNCGATRSWYAFIYLQLTRGRLEDGASEARNALESDPLSSQVRTLLGACLAMCGRYDQALPLLRLVAESDPEALMARHLLGLALCWAGKFGEAAGVFEGAMRMSGYSGFAASSLVTALARSGRSLEAKALNQQMTERHASEYVPFAGLAEASFAIGNESEARALARLAEEEGEAQFLLFARYAPHLAWLR